LEKEGFERKDYYIHADAALHGMILPFVNNPEPFTFEDGIDSISVSGHKMIGAPMPCGIVLTKKTYTESFQTEVEYIVAKDKTISGSRNGISPMIMWKAINSYTKEDFKSEVALCFNNADYIIKRLQK
jgi:histidine decarboxylase